MARTAYRLPLFLLCVAALCASAYWGARLQSRNVRTPSDLARPSLVPDRIVLTWSSDPATSQAITWRSTSRRQNVAQVSVATHGPEFAAESETHVAASEDFTGALGACRYHSVELTDLKPDTVYAYRVGDGDNWSEWFQFRTAKAEPAPFSFVYFGDAQNDIREHWSRVIREAALGAPRARFFIHAGDLINKAESDSEWGEWFAAGSWLNSTIPQVPTPGNHEYAKQKLSSHWKPQFSLPRNGPAVVEETCYTFDFQGVRIVSLNSNEQLAAQAAWLDQVLANNPQKWTILTFHHPVFSSSRVRDNKPLRAAWKPIIDKHRVDLVLTGHDHTYQRTGFDVPATEWEPIQDFAVNVPTGDAVREPTVGTVYVVSVSGPKMYPLDKRDFMARVAVGTQTYQIIHVDGDTLKYESRTALGELYDAFTLKKRPGRINELINQSVEMPERMGPGAEK
jgi:3',5'-cyclic AMP phosphodiesterase CpdA